MLSKCIVTYGNYARRGDVSYHDLAMRQRQSLKEEDCDHRLFTDKDKLPKHTDNPYAFKAHAIEYARSEGFDLVLWCDSPLVRIKPLDRLWKHIEDKGYIFFDNDGYNNGQWSTDRMLDYFGYDREEAQNMRHLMACCFGLNFNNPIANQFQEFYFQAAEKKIKGVPLFKEDWKVSRHDQTAASFICHILDIELTVPHETFFTYDNPEHRKAYGPIKDSVCLVSR